MKNFLILTVLLLTLVSCNQQRSLIKFRKLELVNGNSQSQKETVSIIDATDSTFTETSESSNNISQTSYTSKHSQSLDTLRELTKTSQSFFKKNNRSRFEDRKTPFIAQHLKNATIRSYRTSTFHSMTSPEMALNKSTLNKGSHKKNKSKFVVEIILILLLVAAVIIVIYAVVYYLIIMFFVELFALFFDL